MKSILFYLAVFTAVFFISTSVSYANLQIIEKFEVNVTPNSYVVNIEWKTTSESNVQRFEVQRLVGIDFKTIHTQNANGKPSTYKFTDRDSFRKESTSDASQSSTEETYRIKIVYSNSQVSYSDRISINCPVNSVKRTLGMLKEMFK